MFLQFRPVKLNDLKLCLTLIRNHSAFPTDADRNDLLAMWTELLGDGRMIGAVMEDATATVSKRIAWLCFKVFTTQTFATYLKSKTAAPYPARQLLDLYRAGEELPLLCLTEIARANSRAGSGLNMLVTHYGSPYPIRADCPEWNEVGSNLLEFTDYFSSGYNTQELFEEFYDSYNSSLAIDAGFLPRNNFDEYYRDHALPPENETPYLLGVTATEAVKRPGTIAAAVFHYQKPRFFFRPAEQELLIHALLGETDEEIADRLNIAHVTVRKRWGTIYERVTETVPDFYLFLASPTPEISNGKTARGPEKKRRLLAYLRRHHEELRPLEYDPVQ